MVSCNRKDFLVGALAASALAGCAGLSTGKGWTVRIAHCGDPQFGFGAFGRNDLSPEEAYRIDLARFERTIEFVNRARPDLCFIAGDMTNRAVDLERDWPRLVRRFEVPLVVTPGNHDMGQSLTRENVERFERVFGYEYKSLKVGGWRFISGNSQYWRLTEEKERQARYEAWLKRELASAKAAGRRAGHRRDARPAVRGLRR